MAGYNYLDVNPKLDKWITDTETGALIGVRQCQEKTLTVWNISNSTPGVFTSSQLATALTDETGSGAAVFATSPALVTPMLGVATATSLQSIVGNVTPAAGTFTALTSTTSTTLASESVALAANNLPVVRPTLNLDFANSKIVDPRITFTRASTATRINQKGLIETVASGAPRIDYDPVTLVSKGLLVEEQRTNVVQNGTTFAASAVVSTGTATAPDGSTAYKVVPNAGAVSYPDVGNIVIQSINNSTSVGQTTDYSYTGYFKNHGPRNYQPYIVIDAVDVNGLNHAYALMFFDATSGAFYGETYTAGWSEVSAPAAVMMPCGMWKVTWVVRFTQQSLLRTQIRNNLQIANEVRTTVYTADGASGFQYACLQFEQGSFPTSYIPTTTAAVTRAADIATMTGGNFSSWYRQDEGTFVVDFDVPATTTDSTARVPVGVSDGTHSQSMYTHRTSSSANVVTNIINGSVTQASMFSGTASVGVNQKNAFAYKTNDFAALHNGGSAVTDTSGTMPSGITQMYIGGAPWGSGANTVNSHISRIAYYPIRLANATLQALSTL